MSNNKMLLKALYTRPTGPRQIHRHLALRMASIERTLSSPSTMAALSTSFRPRTAQGLPPLMDAQLTSKESDTMPLAKIKQIMEQYKHENFKQTLPSRFKKELIVAIDPDRDGYVSLDDLDQFIINIGMSGRITRDEVQQAFADMGLKRSSKEPMRNNGGPAFASLVHVDEVIDLFKIAPNQAS